MSRKKKIRSYKSTTLPGEALPKKQLSKEDKTCAMEEKKLRKEQEKLQKAALKEEETERKKLEKEKKKWEKGKLALKSIVAEVDTKVVEGSIGELKHGSHECVLTSPEIVADGIYNMCYKDEPVEYSCNPCNFDLCKPCSKIPQKVSHDFHPDEHPLEFCVRSNDGEYADMLCSGCGNLFTEPFYYKCKDCEIYLELGCGILRNTADGWNAEEKLHYSHAHMIRRCRPGRKVEGSCLLCELPLSPSSICYGCVKCYSFVHESCLDSPRQIHHPAHPHPLIRLDFTNNCGGGKYCDACRCYISGVPLGCQKCNFNLHLRCADSLLRGLMHKSHPHRLFYAACDDFVGMNHVDAYYHCLECKRKFYFESLWIPKSVFKKSYHSHPLVCQVFLPEDDSLECCGVCETLIHKGHHAYSCKECDFVGHIECILREKVPSPLYLKDLYSCANDMTWLTYSEDWEEESLENRLVINDIGHNHLLALSDIRGFRVCKICGRDVVGKAWECKVEACTFMAHDYCVKLGQPSRHGFHLNHPLTLLPNHPAGVIMNCDTCEKNIDDFNLFCRICSFIICTKCMPRAKQYLEELHRGQKFIGTVEKICFQERHSLVEVMVSKSYPMACTICDERLGGKVLSCVTCEDIYHPRCIERGRKTRHPLHYYHELQMELTSGSNCIACQLSIQKYGYNCSTCKVSFHVKCIAAASTPKKMDSHKHFLYNFWIDDLRLNRVCCVCGKPCGVSFYGCIDCNNFNSHIDCIGFPTNVKNHRHQHTVVQSNTWYKMSCSLCGLDIESSHEPIYSCHHCEDVFHMQCIMSMVKREATTEEEQIKDIYFMFIERDLYSMLKNEEDVYQPTRSDEEDSDDEDYDFSSDES